MVVIIATLTFHDSQVLLQGCIVHYGTNVYVFVFRNICMHACMLGGWMTILGPW